GVEVSVGDLLAQREAVPLADLFGKRRRAACPVNAYGFWHLDPAGTGIEYLPPEGAKGWNYWRAAPAMTVPRLWNCLVLCLTSPVRSPSSSRPESLIPRLRLRPCWLSGMPIPA